MTWRNGWSRYCFTLKLVCHCYLTWRLLFYLALLWGKLARLAMARRTAGERANKPPTSTYKPLATAALGGPIIQKNISLLSGFFRSNNGDNLAPVSSSLRRQFCSRSHFRSLEPKQLPCVQHTLFQTPTHRWTPIPVGIFYGVDGAASVKQRHFLCCGDTVDMGSTLQIVRVLDHKYNLLFRRQNLHATAVVRVQLV